MAEIIDFNVHLGASIQGHSLEVAPLLAEMDRLNIHRAVLSPVRPLAYAYGPANDEVARARAENPERFFAFGRVDARLPDAAAEAERCLGTLKLDGLFLHPWEDTISAADHRFDPVLEVCQQHRVPVLVATGHPMVAEALQVADLAARFADVKVVMTNGGQINISGLGQKNAWLALEARDNLFITTSGVYREDFLEEVVTNLGAEKVLFGSQAPVYDQDFELHRILWAHVDDEIKAKVLSANALRILDRG